VKKKNNLFQTWKEIVFDPLGFYQKLSARERYKEPSLFFLKIQALLLGVSFLLIFLIFGFFFSLLSLFVKGIRLWVSLGKGAILLGILALPFILLVLWGLLFVGAGILHFFVLVLGGKKGYKETFKVVAYASAPLIFSFLPFINWLVSVYVLVLQVVGLHKRQKLSWGRSVAAVLLPWLVLVVLVIAFLFFLINNMVLF